MARIRAKNGNVFEVFDEDLAAHLVKQGHERLDDDGDPAGGEGETGELVEPKSNSPKKAWLAWAEHLGIEVPDGAKTADIKVLVANFKPAPAPVPPTGNDGNPPAGDNGADD